MGAVFDLVIRDGKIIDGTGTSSFVADLGISNGKITCIGELTNAIAKEWICAKGLVVAPGFIDMHSHQEASAFAEVTDDAKIMQGVTTEVNGNCGISCAPVSKKYLPELRKYVAAPESLHWDWESFAEYLTVLEKNKPVTNVVPLVGHGALRIAVMGFQNRKPTENELNAMKELLTQALAAGAYGLSSGLIYPPGVFADTDELVELCKVVASNDGLYASHIRNESDRVLEAVEEGIEIAQRSLVNFHFSHHKVAGRANWGKSSQTLGLIDEANKKGLSITCDVYPYEASSTMMSALLPPWALEGGVGSMLERLGDKATRERIKTDLKRSLPGWENLYQAGGADKIIVAAVKRQHQYEGMTLEQLAESKGRETSDAFMDLLEEEQGAVYMTLFLMAEDDIKTILRHQTTVVGSDGVYSPHMLHPRHYGTFPRILAKYVRGEQIISLSSAIHKMTGMTANRLGLCDRGIIRPGLYADIVVFDPKKIQDRATYTQPRAYPDGVDCVIINGEIAVRDGKFTGLRAGKILKKQER
jgi:N-acyl-D-amino-acid deacylase